MIRITSETTLAETRWVELRERRYIDREGREKAWAYLERRGAREAAVVVARTGESDSLLLIRQFRIPLGCFVLEFPAGLIDNGETPAAAAARELREETGYCGVLLAETPPLPTSPGLTSELVRFFFMRIPEQPQQGVEHEPSEQIETLLLDPAAQQALLAGETPPDTLIDTKVLLYLSGARLMPDRT